MLDNLHRIPVSGPVLSLACVIFALAVPPAGMLSLSTHSPNHSQLKTFFVVFVFELVAMTLNFIYDNECQEKYEKEESIKPSVPFF